MPLVGFEPMILAFQRAKTIQASDRAAIVIGKVTLGRINMYLQSIK
jgi:hypothetical protein